jgi:pyruvate/2-oxoglutarate dehydrogenase complex dihydrolipoamide acyltransferase (E2) component
VGDSVTEDEIVAKIETDKTTIEIKAPKAGVIEELLVADGATITANLPIIKLRAGAGAGAAKPAAAAPAPAPAAAAPTPAPQQEQQAQAAPTSMPEAPARPAAQKPLASVPIASVPVTAFKPLESSASLGEAMNINKISGTRNETRVSGYF